MLLDFELKRRHIGPDEIQGYDFEATTHMAVAALVAGDGADAGLGILAAANAMTPLIIPIPTIRKDTTAITLMDANQNSASP